MNKGILKPLIWYADDVWVCSCVNWLGDAPEDIIEYSKWVSAGAGHTPVGAYKEWLVEVDAHEKWLKQSKYYLGEN